jgi:hypothetical protein
MVKPDGKISSSHHHVPRETSECSSFYLSLSYFSRQCYSVARLLTTQSHSFSVPKRVLLDLVEAVENA